jgi:hypothetical protein
VRRNGKPFLVNLVKVKRIYCDHKKRREKQRRIEPAAIGF